MCVSRPPSFAAVCRDEHLHSSIVLNQSLGFWCDCNLCEIVMLPRSTVLSDLVPWRMCGSSSHQVRGGSDHRCVVIWVGERV